MRLAYVSTDPGVAYGGTKGASVHVRELVGALASEGADVLLLVEAIAPEAPPPPPGVTLELLPGPRKGATAVARLAAEPLRARWLERRFSAFGAEAVYERLALHSSAASVAARAGGLPHLLELNARLREEAAAYRSLEEPRAAEAHERASLADAACVLAVSRPLAAYARARGARRVEVVPNAVDVDRFTPAATQRRPPLAVFAGSLRPWHGIEVLVEAWRMLGPRAPRLLVVGDGPGAALFDAVAAERTGALPHDAVPAVLGRAGIGIVSYGAAAPSYFSPLKLFEYLAAGLPVVAASLPGVLDVVDDRTALLVPPGDAPALAGAVHALCADPGLRARMGRAGRQLVAAQHTWGHRARRVLALAGAGAALPARAAAGGRA